MLKMLIWDCYSWAAWQFFKVKDRKGNYREIPGSRSHYAGFFPLWRLSYAIIPYVRMKFEKCGLGFQNLYNMPQGVEVPWLTYQQFGNLVGNLTDIIAEEETGSPPSMRPGRCAPLRITMISLAPSKMTSCGHGITTDRRNRFLWKK